MTFLYTSRGNVMTLSSWVSIVVQFGCCYPQPACFRDTERMYKKFRSPVKLRYSAQPRL